MIVDEEFKKTTNIEKKKKRFEIVNEMHMNGDINPDSSFHHLVN